MSKYFYLCFISWFSFGVHAQQKSDEILFGAMKDEMKRSMDELQLPDFDRPFFIMYGVQDQTSYTISGNLGSLLESGKLHQRFKTTTRVLVGDYSFNDESLEDDLFASSTPTEISLPLEDDYYGIRRSFWSSTDNVYREAARHYKKHQQTLKETGKELTDLPHRQFAKGKTIKINNTVAQYNFSISEWENRVRNLSAIFLRHKNVENSTVIFGFTDGHKYLVNSEGVEAKVPIRMATLVVFAQTKNSDGQFVIEQAMHMASTPDKLPSEKEMEHEINKIVERIDFQMKAQKFDDEYRGPVLLMGHAVADFFSNVLFTGRESILANDNIPRLSGLQFNDDQSSMDGKVGKNVMNKSITIKAKPHLKFFNGTELLGHFEIDDEGMVPPEVETVVENGILKSLLNNRTITNPSQSANGFSSGPGVLEVQLVQKDSEKVLKQKLIEQAKKEGLDYALIVRDADGIGMKLLKVYKVSLKDGTETLAQNVIMNQFEFRPLRKVLGASGDYRAFNLGGGSAGIGPLQNSRAGLVSFIVPSAVLLEEVECRPFRMPSLIEENYVSNPLNR